MTPVVARTPRAPSPIPAGHKVLIVGLGATGLSTARFLHRRGIAYAVADDRASPPAYDDLMMLDRDAEVHLGAFEASRFLDADDLVVSPGVPLKTPAVSQAVARGKPVIGDVELFARCVAPRKVVAITGSNGKSTVTSLLARMAAVAGLRVAAGGNLGVPALDLLDDRADADVYILELSSFQLETTRSLRPAASVVLNVSDDHLDRYDTPDEYLQTKLGVHRNSSTVVVNREEAFAVETHGAAVVSFGLDAGADGHFGIVGGTRRAVARGTQAWLDCDDVPLAGAAGLLNVQAAFALVCALRLPRAAMVGAARTFQGLAHRMQHIGNLDGVEWINDSKATNVAAAVCALRAVRAKAVLICGGDGKGASFAALGDAIAEHARSIVLLGRDADKIAGAVAGRVPVVAVADMRAAVAAARRAAEPGDCVLLSPACASFDLYRDYRARGDAFTEAFRELC